MVKPPNYPNITLAAPDGVLVSSPGRKVNEENNAVSAWQNTLRPPDPRQKTDSQTVRRGRRVFEQAGCISCHAGRYLTNNKVISVEKIGTEPTRARSFKKTENIFGKSLIHSPDTPVPLPRKPKILKVPTAGFDPEQIKLSWAQEIPKAGTKCRV